MKMINAELIKRKSASLAAYERGNDLFVDESTGRLDIQRLTSRSYQVSSTVKGSREARYNTKATVVFLPKEELIKDYSCGCMAFEPHSGLCKHLVAMLMEFNYKAEDGELYQYDDQVPVFEKTYERPAKQPPKDPVKPSDKELKKLVEKLSYYKINQLQIYIEHSFLFPGLSEVWRDDTPLTAEDILELDRYCRQYHIDLVPSLSSFGHLYKVLRTRTFRHLGEFPQMADEPFGFEDRMHHHTLNVAEPEALGFAKEMIDRYMALFSSRYFNLCADETFDLGKGRGKALAEEKGTRKMYLEFVRELCNHVVSRGKIPMFWGDIIRSFPEAVSELPKETICLNWGYDANEGSEATEAFARTGIRQYTCPGVNGWNHLIPRIRDSYENIRRMCSYALTYGAEGVLNTDWGDYGHINHPDFSTAGMIYGAAFSWRGEILPFEEISRQISLLEYGDRSESLITLLAGLPEQGFGWRQAVNYLEKGNADKEMFEKTAECLEEIRRAAGELCRILPEIDSSGRERAAAYLIGMRGMELLALTGSFVGEKEFGTKGAQEVSKGVLAQRLEEWFYDYKALWRSTSRESELYRIQNVVYWYADLLREADNG